MNTPVKGSGDSGTGSTTDSGTDSGTESGSRDAGMDTRDDVGADGAGMDAAGGAPGPLKPSANPNYFQDTTGRAILLSGSHTWNNLQDWGSAGAPQPFDFGAYTNFLVAHGHNFTLLWRTELTTFCGLPTTDNDPPNITTSIQPWPRTGPGTADDGLLKFDLSQFDPNYFSSLRSRVMQLNAAGIYAGVYLFTGEWLDAFRCSGDGYPLTGSNNINGIDDGGGDGSMAMTGPNAVTAIQDAMVLETIDTLNDLPNVLWVVSEEAGSNTTWWQGHMISQVRTYEAGKPLQHPIGMATVDGQADSFLYDSNADWVAPTARISPATSCGAGAPPCKVNINDSDHSYFGMWNDTAQENRQYAWENFAAGDNVIFMDPYLVYYPRQNRNLCVSPVDQICAAPDTRWDNFRDNLGYILSYSRRLNLNAVLPSPALCSTTYCLAQTPAIGSEILVYAPNGGSFTVDLSRASGRTMNYEWFDPATGTVVLTGSVPGGDGNQAFSTPGGIGGDSVLYVVDAAGHA